VSAFSILDNHLRDLRRGDFRPFNLRGGRSGNRIENAPGARLNRYPLPAGVGWGIPLGLTRRVVETYPLLWTCAELSVSRGFANSVALNLDGMALDCSPGRARGESGFCHASPHSIRPVAVPIERVIRACAVRSQSRLMEMPSEHRWLQLPRHHDGGSPLARR